MSETNTKPNVEKLNNDRQQQRLTEFDYNKNGVDFQEDLQKIERLEKIDKMEQFCENRANREKCEENKWGQKITIDQKIEEIKEDKSFPYNIPFLGDFLKKREIRKLEAKKEINKIKWMRKFDLAKYFPDLDQREDKQKEKINQIQQEQTKGFNQYILQSPNALTEEQKQKITQIIKGPNIDDDAAKTQQQTQTQTQTKEADIAKGPNSAAIKANKEQNVQQTQTVAQAKQTQTQQVQTVQAPLQERGGMQIAGLGNAGSHISSGATGVGKGQSQGMAIGGSK